MGGIVDKGTDWVSGKVDKGTDWINKEIIDPRIEDYEDFIKETKTAGEEFGTGFETIGDLIQGGGEARDNTLLSTVGVENVGELFEIGATGTTTRAELEDQADAQSDLQDQQTVTTAIDSAGLADKNLKASLLSKSMRAKDTAKVTARDKRKGRTSLLSSGEEGLGSGSFGLGDTGSLGVG